MEITVFDCGLEVGTFDFDVASVQIGMRLGGFIVAEVLSQDLESGVAEVAIRYV